MAERKASIVLELKDFFSSKIGSVMSQLAVLRQGFMAIKDTLGTVTNVAMDLLKEWGKQEQASAKLAQALKTSGQEVENNAKSLEDMATALQKVTIYSDEAITESTALLTTFGLTAKQIQELTPRIVDMASALNMDLNTASMVVGKSIATGTDMMKRYGIVIDETAIKSRDIGAITQQLDARFKGMGEVVGSTTLGAMSRLNNAWGEMKEATGKAMAPILIPVMEKTIALITQLIPLAEKASSLMKAIFPANEKFDPKYMKEYNEHLKKQVELHQDIKSSSEKAQSKIQSDFKNTEKQLRAGLDVIGSEGEETFDEMEEGYMSFAQELRKDVKSWNKVFVGAMNDISSTFGSGMADLIVNGGKFKDAMADIGKQILENFISQVIAKIVAGWIASIAEATTAGAMAGTAYGTAFVASATPIMAGVGGAGAGGAGALAGAGGAGAGVGAGAVGGMVAGGVASIGAGVYGGQELGRAVGGEGSYESAGQGAMIGTAVGFMAGGLPMAVAGGLAGGVAGGLWGKKGGTNWESAQANYNLLPEEWKAKLRHYIEIVGGQPASTMAILGTILGQDAGTIVQNLYNWEQAKGITLAKGGIVMPRAGGTHIIAGEAGQAEAVIPLDKNGRMGIGTTININAGTIVASDQSVKEFARKIDVELFRLNRNRQGVQ